MRRFPPVRAPAATLGQGACADVSDVDRSAADGLAVCIAGDDANDEGSCAETAAVGAATGGLANAV